MSKYLHEQLTKKVIGLAIKVHKELGVGFGEKVYQRAMYLELKASSFDFAREKEVSVRYQGVRIGKQVLDFVVEKKLVLEIKKVETLSEVHVAQVVSYLSATGLRLGLLLNFGRGKLEIKRVIK